MLAADVDLQDILALNLSRAAQICVDLAAHLLVSRQLPPPDTMGQACERLEEAKVLDAELALRMRKAVGIRNIAVHAYDAIDWDLVFAIASTHLADFEDFAKTVALPQAGEGRSASRRA